MKEDIVDILIKFFCNNKDVIIALFTAFVGLAGAYFGGKMTLKATKLSIKNDEDQNRIILMTVVSEMIDSIKSIKSRKSFAFSDNASFCNTFDKFKGYNKIWELLPKSGLSADEIETLCRFNMRLEETYNYYQIISNNQKGDREKIEWNLCKALSEKNKYYVLIKVTENDIAAVEKIVKEISQGCE